MSAIEDTIEAVVVLIDKLEESQQAHTGVSSTADDALNVAQALGAEGVAEALAEMQVKATELGEILDQASTVATELLAAAQSAKT